MEGSNGDAFGGAGAAPTGQEAVLHVTIENMVYPVTLETLAIIFKKYGPVQKILTFTKNNKFQVSVDNYVVLIKKKINELGLQSFSRLIFVLSVFVYLRILFCLMVFIFCACRHFVIILLS